MGGVYLIIIALPFIVYLLYIITVWKIYYDSNKMFDRAIKHYYEKGEYDVVLALAKAKAESAEALAKMLENMNK